MMLIDDSTEIELARETSVQNLGPGEGAVLLRMDSGQLYSCNDTAAAFLEALDRKRSFGEITEDLLRQFEVERDTLRRDLTAIIEELSGEGLLRVAQ